MHFPAGHNATKIIIIGGVVSITQQTWIEELSIATGNTDFQRLAFCMKIAFKLMEPSYEKFNCKFFMPFVE